MASPTREEIEAARTPAGGWTRAQLAAWGVPWPPQKGWKARLLNPEPAPVVVPQAVVDHEAEHPVEGFFCPPPSTARAAVAFYEIGHIALYPDCPWRAPSEAYAE